MVKKLVSVGLTAVVAVSLWSTISAAGKRTIAKIHKFEVLYKYGLSLGEEDK